jgi:uncharacterized protein (DUF58 family)
MIGEFLYEIEWPASRHRPGHHRSGHAGGGFEFSHHAPLLASPDARRLDLRATLRDAFGQPIVRVYRQRSAISVFVLADLSASLAFEGERSKHEVLCEFTASAAYSASRTGDAFGFIGANAAVLEELYLPPTHAKGVAALMRERLSAFRPSGDSVAGLVSGAGLLGRSRALVFLLSDFHFPLPFLDDVLRALVLHHVVPVVLWDRAEYQISSQRGLTTLTDLESGSSRAMLVRPATKRRLLQAFQDRQRAMRAIFSRHRLRPLELLNGFDADQVSRYFLDPHVAALC